MKIQYVSDLHLEFKENSDFLKRSPLVVSGDILLIAGDSDYLTPEGYKPHSFWRWASKNYRQVIVALGNHEFYQYYDLAKLKNGFTGEILPNVHFYYNNVVRVDNVDIIISTLWSRIAPEDQYFVEKGVSDFYRIRYNGHRFSADDFNNEHSKCLDFIKQAVIQSDASIKIVLTHHVPTLQAVIPVHRNSPINGAFATELGDYIADSGIDYWIYGHSHFGIDCQIGKTKILSNQLGYIRSGENIDNGFDPGKFLEV